MARYFLGELQRIQLAAPIIVPYPEGPPPKRSLIVVRVAPGQSSQSLRAYWNICQHLPIPLDGGAMTLPEGEALVCITHGARYRPQDGLCTAGPCEGASLEPVPITIEEGRVYADL